MFRVLGGADIPPKLQINSDKMTPVGCVDTGGRPSHLIGELSALCGLHCRYQRTDLKRFLAGCHKRQLIRLCLSSISS